MGRVLPLLQETDSVSRISLTLQCWMHTCAWPRLRWSGEQHLPLLCCNPEDPSPVITLPKGSRASTCPSSQQAGKTQLAVNFFSTNYQITNLLFNCTLFEGGHCMAGTYLCLWITQELGGSYFKCLGMMRSPAGLNGSTPGP